MCTKKIQEYIVVLFIIVPNWKQPTYPPIVDYMHEFLYHPTIGFYIAMRKHNPLLHGKILMTVIKTILNKRNQISKSTYYMISFI